MNLKKKMWPGVVVGLAGGLLLAAGGKPLEAQHPVERTEWTLSPLRTHDQPVLPIFEGWYQNADGTYNLCFGYYNLNTAQVLDVPLGPDNFIEPSRYDGGQPTHFAMSQLPNVMRSWCVFTVNVPEDIGTERVVWTLQANGHEFSIPGHIGSPHYIVDEPEAVARDRYAPVLRFEPDGPQGRGRNGITAGPLSVAVGRPLTLEISVTGVDGSPEQAGVLWVKHQGPGKVTFSERLINVEVEEEGAEVEEDDHDGRVTTTATFDEPGTYLLLVQAVDNVHRDFEFHCCWTNGFLQVVVTP